MPCFATDRGVPKEILRMRDRDPGAAADMLLCAARRAARPRKTVGEWEIEQHLRIELDPFGTRKDSKPTLWRPIGKRPRR